METAPNTKRKNVLISFLGWYGVAAILLAYVLVSFSELSVHGALYQLLNFTGSIGVMVETYIYRDYQPFWLNLVWAAVALVALASMVLRFT